MTTAVHRYPISAFKDVMRSGFEAHLPDSVLEMIRSLADKVGAADYIRTPKFPRQQAGGGSGHAMGDGWSVQVARDGVIGGLRKSPTMTGRLFAHSRLPKSRSRRVLMPPSHLFVNTSTR